MTATSVLDLVDTCPVDDESVPTAPGTGDAPAGMSVPAGAISLDALTATVRSAMTLFGRVEVTRVAFTPQFSNGRWVAP